MRRRLAVLSALALTLGAAGAAAAKDGVLVGGPPADATLESAPDDAPERPTRPAPAAAAKEPTPAFVVRAVHLYHVGFRKEQGWAGACDALGRALAPGTGPWGLGLFRTFRCHQGKRPGQTPAGHWQLVVEKTKQTVRLELWPPSPKDGKRPTAPLATTEFAAAPGSLGFLADESFALLLAADLLDQLPALAAASGLRDDAGDVTGHTAVAARFPLPPPPATLVLYRLARDEERDLWVPQLVAEAPRLPAEEDPVGGRLHGRDPQAGERPLHWRPEGDAALGTAGRDLWIHDGAGAGAYHGPLAERIASARSELANGEGEGVLGRLAGAVGRSTRRTLSRGSASLLYGAAVAPSNVYGAGSYVSALVELRGAPLAGLTLGVDAWPQVRGTFLGLPSTFGGRRLSLGWRAVVDPGLGFTALEVQPRLGLWSFNATLPFFDETQTLQTAEWHAAGSVTAGALVGLERAGQIYRLRGFVADDLTVTGKGNDSSGSILQLGGLLDFRLPRAVTPGDDVELSVGGFGSYVRQALRHQGSYVVVTPTVTHIEVDNSYVGLGLTLSW